MKTIKHAEVLFYEPETQNDDFINSILIQANIKLHRSIYSSNLLQ